MYHNRTIHLHVHINYRNMTAYLQFTTIFQLMNKLLVIPPMLSWINSNVQTNRENLLLNQLIANNVKLSHRTSHFIARFLLDVHCIVGCIFQKLFVIRHTFFLSVVKTNTISDTCALFFWNLVCINKTILSLVVLYTVKNWIKFMSLT